MRRANGWGKSLRRYHSTCFDTMTTLCRNPLNGIFAVSRQGETGMSRGRTFLVIATTIILGIVIAMAFTPLRYYAERVYSSLNNRTVERAVGNVGDRARERWRPFFEGARIPYPPSEVILLALKEEKRLEVWALSLGRRYHLRDIDVLAASGKPGPKLREGDRQVPEGNYRIESLNPNSAYHLSMKLDYPNAFDRARAEESGRTNPGGDIFIHGGNVSIGCIAVGDEAIEDLFTLVADVGIERVGVAILPNDLRRGPPVTDPEQVPSWTPRLYDILKNKVERFR